MTDQFHFLRQQFDRARQHVERYRVALERFDWHADPADIMADRARDRLFEDLKKAETDAGWCEIALADASAPTEVPA